jgi:peroxiredoxin
MRAVLALVALALGSGCAPAASSSGGNAPNAQESSSSGGSPDFELPALDGSRVRLSEHRGKNVVLLDFWATFCEPCLLAMPHLDELYRKYRERGFVVLGVSIDGSGSAAKVRGEVEKLGVSFPILLDQETQVVALYNPRTSAPYSVLIDREGRIVRRQEGYTTGDRDALEADIAAVVGR